MDPVTCVYFGVTEYRNVYLNINMETSLNLKLMISPKIGIKSIVDSLSVGKKTNTGFILSAYDWLFKA